MPTKAILVPCMTCMGFLIYLANSSWFQVMPEFLLASEYWKPSKVPALRPSSPFNGGPSLTFASAPMSWQGAHLRKEVSPAATSCAAPIPAEASTIAPAINHVLMRLAPLVSACAALRPAFRPSGTPEIAGVPLFEWRPARAVSTPRRHYSLEPHRSAAPAVAIAAASGGVCRYNRIM